MTKSAFTLLEMSVVLAIIAVVVAGGMTIFGASMQKRQLQDTQVKLKTIQAALLNFRIANNRLPCPADVTLALTHMNFGLEAGTLSGGAWTPDVGSCYSASDTASANFSNILKPTGTVTAGEVTVSAMGSTAGITVGMGVIGAGIPIGDSVATVGAGTVTLTIPATATGAAVLLTIGNNVEGMVPTATLGLSDDYAIDGWGRRIMYAVDNRFTATGALVPYPSAVTLTGTVSQNSTNVASFTSTTGLSSGMYAYGSGIPAGDAISSVGLNAVTLAAAVASDGPNNVAEPVSFSPTLIPGFAILSADTTPRMTINDQSGNPKTTTAAYVLVSFGPNGHGSYPRTGAALTSRLDANSDNADEGRNCDCYVVGTGANGGQTNGTPPAGIFVQKQPTSNSADINNSFDDVVVYGTRSDLRGPTE